ncbi:hypothetical protein ABBQ32_013351 [Trebouxia sp. C0010 RCD-2024]
MLAVPSSVQECFRAPSASSLSKQLMSKPSLTEGALSKRFVSTGLFSKGSLNKAPSNGGTGTRPRTVQGSSLVPYINRSTAAKGPSDKMYDAGRTGARASADGVAVKNKAPASDPANPPAKEPASLPSCKVPLQQTVGKGSVAGALGSAPAKARTGLKQPGGSGAALHSAGDLFSCAKPSSESTAAHHRSQAWAVAHLRPWRGSPFRQPRQRRPMSNIGCTALSNSPATKMGRSNTAAIEHSRPCSDARTVSQIDSHVHRQGNVLIF